MTKKRKVESSRDKAIAVALIIIATFGALGTLDLAAQQGIQLPSWLGGGSIAFSSNPSSSGYSSTSGTNTGSQLCIGSACIPTGQVAFNLQLVSVYSDGTNSTISNQNGLPQFAAITWNGKPVDHIDSQAVVGYVSSAPLPSGTTANFNVNFTAYDEGNGVRWWHAYTITTGFVNNNELALFRIPDFSIPAIHVYSDKCSVNSTGSLSCDFPSNNPVTRRVDWLLDTNVSLAVPGFLSLIPVVGATAASADFSATGVVGCTNCATTTPSPLAGQFTTDGFQKTTSPPSNCSACGQVSTTTTVNPNANYALNTNTACAISLLPSLCLYGKTVKSISTDSYGKQTGGTGTTKSSASVGNVGNAPGGHSYEHVVTLLPINYYSLPTLSLPVVSPWALTVFLIIWFGIIGVVGYALLAWKKQ